MVLRKFILGIFLMINLVGFGQNALNEAGLRTGRWKGYYADSTLRYEAFFENGKPVGTMNRYNEKGQLTTKMNFYKGTDRCFVILFAPDGHIKAKGVYDQQIKDSTWIYLGKDESVRLIENYKTGKLSGISESFYKSGNVSRRIIYADNLKQGQWIQFFENGDTMMIANYKNDELNGKYLTFYPDSKIEVSGHYYNDFKNGDWFFFSEEGDTIRHLKYDKGTVLNPEELEKSYELFIKNIEDNTGNIPDPALEGGF